MTKVEKRWLGFILTSLFGIIFGLGVVLHKTNEVVAEQHDLIKGLIESDQIQTKINQGQSDINKGVTEIFKKFLVPNKGDTNVTK